MLEDIRKRWSTKGLFLVLSLLAMAVVYFHHQFRLERERLWLTNLSITYGEHIKDNLYQSLSATYSFAAWLKAQKGSIEGFEAMAGEMLAYYPCVMSFQLAPMGVVTQVAPLKGNEEALGHDLFGDPARAKEALAAKESGELILAGPFRLRQGGVGVIGRLPIFLDAIHEEPRFWGFVIVVIRFPEVLETVRLEALKSNQALYRLSKIDPFSGEGRELAGSKEGANLSRGVENRLLLPGAIWSLEIFPAKRWSDWVEPLFEGLMGLVLALLITSWVSFVHKRKREEALESLAFFDPLTKLPNRTRLFEYFSALVNDQRHEGEGILVGFLDLDRFKEVNDTFGHKVGDLLLLAVVERLGKHMRGGDMLSRQGGDEFIFLWPHIGSLEACRGRLDELLALFSEPFEIQGEEIRVNVSIGVSFYRGNERDLDALIMEADAAMYQAKIEGRGRYCLFQKP